MTAWLTRLHRWLGLALAAPVLVIAGTGTALVFHDAIVLARLGLVTGNESHDSFAAPAADLAAIERLAGTAGWRTIKLPAPDFPLYRIWLASGEQAYFVPGSARFADRFDPGTRIESLLFEIHTRMLAGPPGEWIIGGIGVLLLGLLALGLATWWPTRRALRPDHLLLRCSMTPRQLLRSHRAWGAVMAPAVALSAGTGVMLVFPQATLTLLGWILPEAQDAAVASPPVVTAAPVDWPAVVRGAEGAFDDDELVFVIAPEAGRPHLTLRTRRAAEWHPNGRSEIDVDPRTGRLLAIRDATTASAAQRLFHKLYPIHVARGSAAPLQPLTISTGVVLLALVITSIAGWCARRRRRCLGTALAQHG